MSSAARHAMAVAIFVLVVPLAGCASVGSAAPGSRPNVVTAENVWGSIASQLGGDRVSVTSIIDNPNADPHDYEPTTEDARAMASANFVIENGVGYDPWAQRLVDANPVRPIGIRQRMPVGVIRRIRIGVVAIHPEFVDDVPWPARASVVSLVHRHAQGHTHVRVAIGARLYPHHLLCAGRDRVVSLREERNRTPGDCDLRV